MSATPEAVGQRALSDARSLALGVGQWLRTNLPQTVLMALLGFAGGYAMNVVLMAIRYDGHAVPSGAPATGTGNLVAGSAFWFLAPMVLFALIGYRRAVGKERFWADLRRLPDIVAALVRRDGAVARVHLLWGFAASMLLQTVVSPALSGVLAVGLVLSVPTVLGRILTGLVFRAWSAVSTAVNPGRTTRPPGFTAMVVGLLGTAGAFLLGAVIDRPLLEPLNYEITPTTLRILLAIAAAVAAFLLARSAAPPSATAVLLLVLGAWIGYEVLAAAPALADDGGWSECGNSLRGWLDCIRNGGADTVLIRGVPGAIASGAGAAAGGALGGLLGGWPETWPEGWGDDDWPGPQGDGTAGAGTQTWPDGLQEITGPDGDPVYINRGYDPEVPDGYVWWGDEWVDPDRANDLWAEEVEAIAQRDRERDAFWAESQQLSAQWMRDRVAELEAEAAAERADAIRRQQALDQLERIEDYATRHGYDDILQRAEDRAWSDDGGIDVDYVERLGDVLRNHIGRDTAAPDSVLQQGWVSDFVSTTWDDARHNAAIRIGLGVLSGGSSEIYYQSQAVYDRLQENVNQAVDEGRDYTFTDALRDSGQVFVEENLPVNTINLIRNADPDNPPSWTDIATSLGLDALQSLDVIETGGNLRGALGGAVRSGDEALEGILRHGDDLAPPTIRTSAADELAGGAPMRTPADLEVGGVRAGEGLGGTRALDEGLPGTRTLDEGVGGTRTLDEGAGGARSADEIQGAHPDADGVYVLEEPPDPYRAQRTEIQEGRDLYGGDATRAPQGTVVDDDALQNFGMTPDKVDQLSDVATRHDVTIEVRPTNVDSMQHLEAGSHPKPPYLKNKTINEIDRYLMSPEPGALPPPDVRGQVGSFEPRLPDPSELPPDIDYARVESRWRQRMNEWGDNYDHMRQLEADGTITIGDDGIVRNAETGNSYAGDHDLYSITTADGTPAPPEVRDAVLAELADPPVNAQHGAHTDWAPSGSQQSDIYSSIRANHRPGGEGLLQIGAGDPAPTVSYDHGGYLTPSEQAAQIQEQINATLEELGP